MANEEEELVTKLKAMLQDRYGDASAENLRKLFDAYDEDHDLSIDAGELEHLLKDAGIGNAITRGIWVKGVLGKLDADRDRTVSWDELSRVVGI